MVENTEGEFNKGKSRKKVRGLRMIRAASPRIPSHIGGTLTGRSLAFSSSFFFFGFCLCSGVTPSIHADAVREAQSETEPAFGGGVAEDAS